MSEELKQFASDEFEVASTDFGLPHGLGFDILQGEICRNPRRV